MNVLDLFSGVGLMSLGLGWAGMRTVGFCEIEPACRFWLREQWPTVPIFEDVRSLTGEVVLERCCAVDLVAGGFPCQPVSVAGARRGTEDARWLWPEMFRLVRELRPRWVLAENVPGLRTLGADGVLADLEAEGYACWPLVVGADDAGAPHRRKRVWIVAHAQHHGREGAGSGRLGDAESERLALGPHVGGDGREEQPALVRAGDPTLVRGVVARPGERQREWEAPRLADAADGGQRRSARAQAEEGPCQPEAGRLAGGPEGRGCAGLADADLPQRGLAAIGSGRGEGPAPQAARAAGAGSEGDADAREPESRLGRPTDGSARRLARHRSAARRARLRAWGNGVYAPLVADIGRAIERANLPETAEAVA